MNAVEDAPGANVATVSHSLHPPSFQRARIVVVPAQTCETAPLAALTALMYATGNL